MPGPACTTFSHPLYPSLMMWEMQHRARGFRVTKTCALVVCCVCRHLASLGGGGDGGWELASRFNEPGVPRGEGHKLLNCFKRVDLIPGKPDCLKVIFMRWFIVPT